VLRARKTLVIRNAWRTGRSHLLGLPREIRDIIYQLTLVEPAFWDEVHGEGCPVRDLKRAWERPVHRTTSADADIDDRPERTYYLNADARIGIEKVEACEQLCRLRQGLGLGLGFRLANKQIYEESESLFWKSNTFCYLHWEDMLIDLESKSCVPSSMSDMPDSAKRKVVRFPLRHTCIKHDASYEQTGRLVPALKVLPNLRELEIPDRVFSLLMSSDLNALLSPLCLERVTVGRFERVFVHWTSSSAMFDLYFSYSFRMPDCHEHQNDRLCGIWTPVNDHYCRRCSSELYAKGQAVRRWSDPWHLWSLVRRPDTVTRARDEVDRRLRRVVPKRP